MIKLVSNGSGQSSLEAFQWTTSEQVYPFEKHTDGSTLYAIRLNVGALSGTDNYMSFPASIADGTKIVKYEAFAQSLSTGGFDLRLAPLNGSAASGVCGSFCMSSTVYLYIDSYVLSKGITNSWVNFIYKK